MKKTTKKPEKRYEARGGPVRKHEAQTVGEALAEIKRKYGTLTPENLLNAVEKDPTNPLHKYFEWDVNKAARAHWLERASEIIRCVHVVPAPGRPPETVRAFVVTGEQQHEYIEREEMLASPKPRGWHVNRALDELRSWVQRYSDLEELENERAAVKQLLRRHDAKVDQAAE